MRCNACIFPGFSQSETEDRRLALTSAPVSREADAKYLTIDSTHARWIPLQITFLRTNWTILEETTFQAKSKRTIPTSKCHNHHALRRWLSVMIIIDSFFYDQRNNSSRTSFTWHTWGSQVPVGKESSNYRFFSAKHLLVLSMFCTLDSSSNKHHLWKLHQFLAELLSRQFEYAQTLKFTHFTFCNFFSLDMCQVNPVQFKTCLIDPRFSHLICTPHAARGKSEYMHVQIFVLRCHQVMLTIALNEVFLFASRLKKQGENWLRMTKILRAGLQSGRHNCVWANHWKIAASRIECNLFGRVPATSFSENSIPVSVECFLTYRKIYFCVIPWCQFAAREKDIPNMIQPCKSVYRFTPIGRCVTKISITTTEFTKVTQLFESTFQVFKVIFLPWTGDRHRPWCYSTSRKFE